MCCCIQGTSTMEKLQESYGEKKVSHKEGESAEICEKMCAERKLGEGSRGADMRFI